MGVWDKVAAKIMPRAVTLSVPTTLAKKTQIPTAAARLT